MTTPNPMNPGKRSFRSLSSNAPPCSNRGGGLAAAVGVSAQSRHGRLDIPDRSWRTHSAAEGTPTSIT